jgi:predicted MPP superfamily phosphohydrolase
MDAIAYIQRESNTLLHRKLINLSEQLLSRRQCYRLLSNDDFDLSNINDESRAELSEIVTQLADQITNRKEKYAVGVRYVDENEVA